MDTNPAHEKDYHSQDMSGRVQRNLESNLLAQSDVLAPSPPAAKLPARLSTIREMARDFGVSIRALRFYEDRGLLHPRREGTSRQYGPRDRLNLKMILKGKQLGFTLSEIHDILTNRDEAKLKVGSLNPDRASPEAMDLELEEATLEMALPPEQIVSQITHLERQRKELDEAIVALRDAHRRLVETPCGALAS
jgi:DNA-binding transcriptional MerR regulator